MGGHNDRTRYGPLGTPQTQTHKSHRVYVVAVVVRLSIGGRSEHIQGRAGWDGMEWGAVNAYGNELNVLALRSVRWSSVGPCVCAETGEGKWKHAQCDT